MADLKRGENFEDNEFYQKWYCKMAGGIPELNIQEYQPVASRVDDIEWVSKVKDSVKTSVEKIDSSCTIIYNNLLLLEEKMKECREFKAYLDDLKRDYDEYHSALKELEAEEAEEAAAAAAAQQNSQVGTDGAGGSTLDSPNVDEPKG